MNIENTRFVIKSDPLGSRSPSNSGSLEGETAASRSSSDPGVAALRPPMDRKPGVGPDYAGRAMRGAAGALLDREQKAALCIWARRAFDVLVESGALGDAAEPTAWRRAQQRKVTGNEILRMASNADYLALKAHFQHLAGADVPAFRNQLKSQVEPRNWALAKLRNECQKAADVLPRAWDYAAGYLRRKHGAPPEELEARPLWQAVFMIRRRAAQLRRSGCHLKSAI